MNNRVFVLAAAIILAVGLGMVSYLSALRERGAPVPIMINTPVPTATLAATATLPPLQVYVNGAVAVPDVYSLPHESRVKQAVEAAGGFTGSANTAVVNLAQPLVDGMHIYVPEMAESSAVPEQVITEPGGQSRSGMIALPGGRLININTADLQELDQLPGVGPATAQKIIAYRDANGAFASVEAILEVSGIGEAKLAQIRDLITTGN